MKAIFDRLDPAWQARFASFGFLCASLMFMASAARLFLPDSSIERPTFESFNFARPYPIDRAMALNAPPVTGVGAGATLSLSGLKLKAVYAENETSGFIVIEEGRDIHFANIGEDFRGYTLVSATGRKAILARDGVNYELKMDDKAAPEARIVPQTQNGFETRQTKTIVTRDELAKYQKDARLIWDNIGIAPVSESGKFKEFRVTFVAKNSVFAELGLQAGDILRSANGIDLDGYASALRLYSEINKMDNFRITIVRNNQTKELVYEIR
ncbi:MAG: hypothetical protein LBU73_02745 [Helicobacteraceae bacterium]|jgi:type II secretion system protein C|nr:hypothetical protein [Helicobacteraceae bacterium]